MRCVKNANKQKLFSLCSRREKLESRKCDTFPNKKSKLLRLVFTRDLNLNDQSFFCSCYLRMCQCSNYFSIVAFLIWLIFVEFLFETLVLFPHSHAAFNRIERLSPFLTTFQTDSCLFAPGMPYIFFLFHPVFRVSTYEYGFESASKYS